MKALVVGGSGSGKSLFAERLTASLGSPRTYIATMPAVGREAHARIQAHRDQRSHLNFAIIECQGALPTPQDAPDTDGVALLDDLGNLLAEALFLPDGTMCDPTTTLARLSEEVLSLSQCYRHMVVVGNEVGCAEPSPYTSTNEWIRLSGALCCTIAAHFDTVIEVVAGQPLVVKGMLP